jgi:signal transduction histidine kinase
MTSGAPRLTAAVLDAALDAAARATARAVADAEERARAAEVRAERAEERLRLTEAELAGFATLAVERLHTPLQTVAGFTEMLVDEVGPDADDEIAGYFARIDAATGRMLGVVAELAAYATATEAAPHTEPVETALLALDVLAGHLAAAERPEIEIGELPAVSADPLLLRRVFDRLVANAVRFALPGSPARITVDAVELAGGRWRIQVADRGIGVPAEHRERIFAPFQQAAEGFGGNGLGLAVCARIVAQHGGEIGVDARPGGGSVFWFTVAGVSSAQPAGAR